MRWIFEYAQKKTPVEDCKALSVSHFRPGPLAVGTIYWTREHRRTGEIGYTIEGERVSLSYTVTLAGWPSEAITDVVHLEATHPHYGGVRWWFLCPGCARRCYNLYLPPDGRRFRCRTCHHLTYRSTQGWDKRVGWYLADIERAIPVLEQVERTGILMRGALPAFRAEIIYQDRFNEQRARKKRRNERRRARYAERLGVS